MRTEHRNKWDSRILIAVLIASLMLLAVPMVSSDGSSADESDIVDFKSYFENNETTTIYIDAGDSETIEVIAWNMTGGPDNTGGHVMRIKLDNVELQDTENQEIDYSIISDMTALLVPDQTEPDNSYEFVVDLSVSKFSVGGTATLVFDFIVMDSPEGTGTITELQYTIALDIAAASAPGANYGKILGIMDTDMDPIIAAAITLIVWIIVAVLVLGIIYPRVVRAVSKKKNGDGKKSFAKKTGTALAGLVLTYGISQSLYVMGGSLKFLTYVDTIAYCLYILFGAMLLWAVFTTALEWFLHNKGVRDDSLLPLGISLGKIAIAMGALAWIMTELGADWTYIVTGMGILGIVIGLGAQSTMTQLFSGLSILCTRPFKPGDLIRLDAGADILKVLDVGFMVTKFENWANAEIFTMPNDKVVASTIVNATKGAREYRVFVFVGIAYGSDVKLAKKLMVEAAHEHPHVVKDGSFDPPAARLNEFADSSLTMRLAAYVDDFELSYTYAGELREAIYEKFADAGITIAFPQIDVHMIDDTAVQKKD